MAMTVTLGDLSDRRFSIPDRSGQRKMPRFRHRSDDRGVEFPVAHAAEKSMPLVRRELQDRPGGVPAVADADLAPRQARDLDAVAGGVTQRALDPVRA